MPIASLVPVHLIVGPAVLIGEKRQSLCDEIARQAGGQIAVEVCRLSEMSFQDVLVRARSLPFLASVQVLRVCDPQKMRENDVDLLNGYLKNPSPSTCLIFEADGLDKKHWLVGAVEKHGRVYSLEEHEGRSAGLRLVQKKLKQYGKAITPQALHRLENSTAAAPEMLDTLIDQLAAYAAGEDRITEETVALFEEKFSQLNIFKLTDAIAQRDPGAAVTLVEKIIRDDEMDLNQLMGFLHSQLRRWWNPLVLLEEGVPEPEVMARCHISPKQAPFFKRQLKGLVRRQVESALEGLFQLDWKIKSGRAEGFPELEAWLVKVSSL